MYLKTNTFCCSARKPKIKRRKKKHGVESGYEKTSANK